jgi:hypothetical protein
VCVVCGRRLQGLWQSAVSLLAFTLIKLPGILLSIPLRVSCYLFPWGYLAIYLFLSCYLFLWGYLFLLLYKHTLILLFTLILFVSGSDILDFAIAHNKPCALVPCCTFHEHYKHRRLPSGKPVKSYVRCVWLCVCVCLRVCVFLVCVCVCACILTPCVCAHTHQDDLVVWLLAKDPRIQKDTLPTGGRNTVLHFLCTSDAVTPPSECVHSVWNIRMFKTVTCPFRVTDWSVRKSPW